MRSVIAPWRVDCVRWEEETSSAEVMVWFSVRSAMSATAARSVMDSVPPEVRATATGSTLPSRYLRRTRSPIARWESSACVFASVSESSIRVCSPFAAFSSPRTVVCSRVFLS